MLDINKSISALVKKEAITYNTRNNTEIKTIIN